jgi:hypothetical protein
MADTSNSASGFDIIFTSDAAGTQKLDHEIESYSASTGQFIAWVRIPALSHTSNTVIYLFYGNSSVNSSQENRTGVWDGNFKGVWHLPNGSTLALNDSTSSGNNPTNNGVTAAGGQIGGGGSFSGFSQYIDAGNNASLQITGNLTIEAWVKPTDFANYNGIVGKTLVNKPAPYDLYLIVAAGCLPFFSVTVQSIPGRPPTPLLRLVRGRT